MVGRRRGFTLIELLVAAAIIAVLTAILLPVVQSVRVCAKRPGCISNMRSIGMAVQMYAVDWANCVPPFNTTTIKLIPVATVEPPIIVHLEEFSNASALKRSLKPYLETEAVWRCPLDPNRDQPGSRDLITAVDHMQTSYLVPWQVSVWRPLQLTKIPTITKEQADNWRPVEYCPYWLDHNPDPEYLECMAHGVVGDSKVMGLRFDGSIQIR